MNYIELFIFSWQGASRDCQCLLMGKNSSHVLASHICSMCCFYCTGITNTGGPFLD